jgi:hypothetical protein
MIRACPAGPDIDTSKRAPLGATTAKERGQVAVVMRAAVVTTKDGPHGQKAKSTFIDRSN